jgi:hypothetical protein
MLFENFAALIEAHHLSTMQLKGDAETGIAYFTYTTQEVTRFEATIDHIAGDIRVTVFKHDAPVAIRRFSDEEDALAWGMEGSIAHPVNAESEGKGA